MLAPASMAARHCPNPECPFFKKFNAPAEYREGFESCSDCGSALADGPVPTLASAVAVAVADPAMVAPAEAVTGSGEFLRPAAVSLVALILAALCDQVLLPGIDPSILSLLAEGGARPDNASMMMSVFSLGLNPFLSAFVLVEFVALLIPSWRRLRTGGPTGRARLRTATVVLAVVFAFVQAWGMGRFYADFGSGPAFEGQPFFSGEGALPIPVIILLLAGAVLLLHGLTVVVDKRGLGNGYAVVLLGMSLAPAFRLLAQAVEYMSLGVVDSLSGLLGLLGLVGLGWATVKILRGQLPGMSRGTEQPSWLPLPASGLAPISFAGALLSLPATLGTLLGVSELASLSRALESSLWVYSLVFFVLLTLSSAAFSVLFYSPQRVGAVWAALTAKDAAERPVVHGRAALRTRELLPVAAAWSVVLGTMAWLPASLAGPLLALPLPSMVALVTGVAIAMDLVEEARKRREATWVPVWPVHRSYEVEPAIVALSAAGIPAWARGVHARTLLQFFGPYFSIDLMVPPERTAEARTLLEKAQQA
ncbi:hypothetical protein [Hyalangium rubrum]|uniref:DUF1858 domain-containing protein n=1 Tax=Hyalangium rubrum TaxID=3103134 RepID=A0ABU5GZT1_9BACT|nr:hypothetical protein [Hyalangium sp. s54d21]MDY7226387.1 hypothetical protein [Hyalangium sp. s54d21]